ncbi:SUMF1/EgtB/PvdO family nonheme iron enzyme [Myxococcota bacterium]|nr:SUMF1/EgtB/PvdO family nonheme iron enzyme [Myxococcota bacterium]
MIPSAEICDGQNNDCDAVTDEGLGTTTCGLGICSHTVDNCSSGVTQTCDPMDGAIAEVCNNSDDDCNGIIDDGLARGCYSDSAGCTETPPGSHNYVCVGRCAAGSSFCGAGAWGSCQNDVIRQAEECNNLDDDCDGSIDETLSRACYTGPTGTLGVGICIGGTQTCTTGAWGTCAGEIRPGTEVCNNIDDNCDNVIDNMGTLTCGLGICNHTVQRCIAGVTQTCDPMAGATTELCNNLDDNCDGIVDQFYGGCYPTATAGCTETAPGSGIFNCIGACQSGTRLCTTGAWGTCNAAVIPATEICDGIDNDCDSSIDEGFGSTSCGLGICAHTIQNCSGGALQTCDPMAGSTVETCNNADDDCDGVIDDGLSRACYGGASGCTETAPGSGVFNCTGVCRTGASVCSTGTWGSCLNDVQPGTEECNGFDDDCDGSTDEGLSRTCYTGPDGTLGVGLCHGGNQTCSSGAWNTCAGEVKPVPEVCDTFDNNCDGLDDNMGETTCGLGSCLHTVQNCVAGAVQTCDPLLGASVEICDTLDNDCDGQSDGLTESCYPTATLGCTWNAGTSSFDCQGSCSAGQRRCPIDSGAWGECENAVIPETEICDGIDNDCDGDIDEGLTEVCYPPGSGTNTGCEDQGDGTWVCQGVCAIGYRECTLGGWGTCGGLVIPTQEICDTLDNDCDGFTDESEDIPGMGQPCGGVGVCAPGVRACIGGVVVCDGGGDPQPGLCDGLDNNCNGLVDEPAELAEDTRIGASCGEDDGACTFGSNECINGALVCVGGVGPTQEVCNGIDDDCDGTIDTGDLCDTNYICYVAECRLVCDPSQEQPCPAGFACIEPQDLTGTNLCYPQLAPCDGIYCAQNEVCRNDECVDPCDPNPCDWFERCWVNRYAGQVGHETEPEFMCFDNSCSAPGASCPYGQFCVEHECVGDPCRGNDCDFTSEYCIRVGCDSADTCTYECKGIPFCMQDELWNIETQQCEKDVCAEMFCPDGEICTNGGCATDACYLNSCTWGTACVNGECVDDPCSEIKCPSYAHCFVDSLDGSAWCEPNEGVWTPPVRGDTMTTAGNGCSTGRGKSPGDLALLLLLGLPLFLGRARRRLGRLPLSGLARRVLPVLVLVFALSLPACQYAEFSLESPGIKILPDADVEPDVAPDADVDTTTCIPEEEICDGVDNDCNDIIDDYWAPTAQGGLDHFQDDPFNCGTCGNICAYVHAQALCVAGECQMGPCHPTWYDFDDRDENGCESSCTISAGGAEICDGIDNDCNGIVDDPWIPAADGGQDQFMTDALNCGTCGRICAFANGEGSCDGGNCELSACNDGFANTDGSAANGCECIISSLVDDTCDGVDNNCDGNFDEQYITRQCFTGGGCIPNGDGTFACTGLCAPGTTTCSGGREQCQGQTSPALEICDLADNDCDGSVDEGYNTQVDVNHCGACNYSCSANAPANMRSVGCSAGVCQYTCLAGFYDLDPGVAGCEYPCIISNNGIERCDDGVDNDCDGTTDEFNALTDVNNCGTCGYSCQSNAPSNMDAVSCTGGSCNFICAPSYYDYDPGTPGCETFCQVSNGGTEACDGADNDCDGTVDEGFNKLTDAANCGTCNYVCADHIPPHMTATGCSAGNCQYACAGGYYNLDGLMSNGCEYACTITNGGLEICDNLDNDCNGRIDTQPDNSPLVENCYTGTVGTNGTGLCHGGTHQCYSGAWSPCQGEVIPTTELCDTLDNDCDTSVDETFNLNTDVLNCGSCNRSCSALRPPNTYASGCSAGVCQFQCSPGYYDIDLNRNTIGGNGCEYACTITNGGIERCDDAFDNDCDGTLNEFNSATDPLNCGSCGYVCSAHAPVNMTATGCSAGVCQYTCSANYYDTVPGTPGCEYYCTVTNGGTELCDSLDNDCDNTVDEGFNKLTDANNCGACGYVCSAHAPAFMTATGCSAGNCTFTCQAGHYDLDGLQSNGCEYACTVTNGGTEICDNLDNDCDGLKDENTSGTALTQACYTGPGGTIGVGPCHGGTQTCYTGVWGVCQGQVIPLTETCDTVDNDCDGTPDDGFNLNTDILNCGMCGISCFASVPPNASVSSCTLGACRYTCNAGTYDLNGDLQLVGSNGCEYSCTPTRPAGSEDCNNLDDDCDGLTDEVSDLVAPPVGYCKTGGGCGATVSSTCQLFSGVKQWVCNYPAAVDRLTGSPNLVAYAEVRCDGLDNDCDLSSDEDFLPLLGSACSDSDLGLCKGTGTYICRVDQTGTTCNITAKGTATAEVCDNIDNDCDGLIDEPAWNAGTNASYVSDSLVTLNVSGQSVFMYKYEASRPTATAGSGGTGASVRACSKAGVIPWNRVTYGQAQQACRAAGMELCEENVWEEGCDGSAVTRVYPYGNTYNTTSCWGLDSGATAVRTTGSKALCTSSGYLALDLSGNLREWVRELITYTSDGKAIYQTRGGSFRDGAEALKCAHDTVALTEDAFSENVGFRCCPRCGNGVLDADEICDDGNRLPGDTCSPVCGPNTCGDGVVQGLEECDCGRDPAALPVGCIEINGEANANCNLNCTIPEELCSILYPEDQDRGAESSDCTDPFCNGTWCGDVTDNDGDGFVEPEDCDDTTALINPAMDENCATAYDDNCNGFINGAEPDKDGDGVLRCVGAVTTDCDDWDPARYPGKPEICGNGIDENCDGSDSTNCATACQIAAYEKSYQGCEYFATTSMNALLSSTFFDNFALVVFNPNSTSATVTITKGATSVGSGTIAANSLQVFYLTMDQELRRGYNGACTDTCWSKNLFIDTDGAFRVVTNNPVTVYQFNPFNFAIGAVYSYSNDASLLLPKHVMTNNYMATTMSTFWNNSSGFINIVGTADNTTVQVTYNGDVEGGPNRGQIVNYTLNMHDVLNIPSRFCSAGSYLFCGDQYDLTGTTIRVTAGDPVAVFAGHNCVYLPGAYSACDHLEEQMMPLETWGKNFVAAYTSPFTNTTAVANMYRVVAAEDGTVVTFTPAVRAVANLNKGQHVEFTATVDFSVTATKPIAVTQFMLGQQYFAGATTGDPSMTLIVPMEQYRKNYTFTVPSSMTNNFVNIIKPVAQPGKNAPTIYFDGVAIPEASFSTAIGNTYFGVHRRTISVAPYNHTITSSQPFGIMVYGHAANTSYMYPGGLDLNIINIVE